MSEHTLQISGMTCASCQHHVERALRGVPGVETANVNLMAHRAHVVSAQPLEMQPLIEAVRHAGYDAAPPSTTSASSNEHAHVSPETSGERLLGLRVVLSLVAGAVAMAVSMPLMNSGASADPLLNAASRIMAPMMPAAMMSLPAQPLRWFLCILSLAVMLLAAPQIYLAAWRAAMNRTTNMNTLVAIGTISAFVASAIVTIHPFGDAVADVYFESVVLILAFLLAGRWLEARARSQATGALRGFAELSVSTARLVDIDPATDQPDYATTQDTILPLDAIQPGDIVRILAGDRVPLDGIIVDGRSSVDESMLTGEPVPVTRTRGDRITAGSLNLDGVLVVRATGVGRDSTLAQMQRLLEEAQSTRAPMQQLADRVSEIFVPAILMLAACTFIVWALALNTGGRHLGFVQPFAATIAVLIIACPCAMGLAVPAAVTVALGRAAKAGLLIKGGESLERIARLDTIALDKTGTLTEGRPCVTRFQAAADAEWNVPTLVAAAAAIERSSTHPLAQAVVAYAARDAGATQLQFAVSDVEVLPGTGVRGRIDGREIVIGNASLLASHTSAAELDTPPDLAYATPLYLLLDGRPQGVFFATDQLRPEAAESVRELERLGVIPLMLTGDTQQSADAIAREAKITDVRARLLPNDKLRAIRKLQAEGRRVGMAGDGINDAASLAQSDAGFAMAAGTDLAREAGDVLLLHSDLRLLPGAIRLGRQTVSVMRQNLGWAFAYNLIGLPIAAGVLYPAFHVLLSPVLASAAMALSSVSVLLNSLRLRHSHM